ncbi:hypothetical protein [Flavobacterium ardleyense]|uniref:hypothetical protein n=1 Tax=Flavobacterium ardleyense TaxID=2038737 RepID=UPI00298D41FE|nr:hypothetical protein [Flavobacterium ardleyense]
MEIENVKTYLKKKWNINPYNFWIPLSGIIKENTIYFETEDFEKNFGYENLNKILSSLNNGKIYSFNEAKEEKIYNEIQIKEYDSPDIFFTNENTDWVIYQTHEKTIAFAGEKLINEIKAQWLNWKEFVNPWEN